jgi:thiol-disulfide isomerase/thioredoxin
MPLLLLACLGGLAAILGLWILPALPFAFFVTLKRSLAAHTWRRHAIGFAVLCGVAALAFGIDPGVLAQTSALTTGKASVRTAQLPVEGVLPSLDGADQWLNSAPLSRQSLKGKVVLVDVWTYSCINCLRTLPFVKAWAQKYKDQGLVVIGVHAPEFAFERNIDNVRKATRELKIDYPVAIDNHYAIWRALSNQYWPALYVVDAQGQIRYHQFGEGGYAESEKVIQQLLADAGHAGAADVKGAAGSSGTNGTNAANGTSETTRAAAEIDPAQAQGVEMAPDDRDLNSPETYVGYEHADNFASPGGQTRDRPNTYAAPARLSVNDWGLAGPWTVGAEFATPEAASGSIVYRFHARDLHMVLGPGVNGKPVRFQVSIDGAAPGDAHGSDVDALGNGVVTDHRLYQLVRQAGDVKDHTFALRFLEPGVQVYAFTFG